MSKNTRDAKRKGKTAAAGSTEPKGGGRQESKGSSTEPSAIRAKSTESGEAGGKRKLGLRGAAPWAARHAAKHAAEARARAAEPPPPGSARATIRVPTGAEELKAKIGELHIALVQIRSLRKNVGKGFYDIGLVLRDIQQNRLYEAKGFGSFEAFLEREIDLGKVMALRLVRIVNTFLREAALEHGFDRISLALAPLEAAPDGAATKAALAISPAAMASKLALPLKPPLGRVG